MNKKLEDYYPLLIEREIYKEETNLDLPNPTGLSSSAWLANFLDLYDLPYLEKLVNFLNDNNITVTKIGYDPNDFAVIYCWKERK